MKNKLKKLFVLAISFILAFSAVFPVEVCAAGASGAKLKQQIKRTYSKARSSFGRSFDGYCGTMTGYQLYYLGLTATRDHQNGNEGYDLYCKQTHSSGGYRIQAYSGKRYTLRQALDAITDKGTKDAYNILVGFQSTPSRAGRKYGHSCIVYGIVDGQVYFVESYGVYLNGTRYREGAPIVCSIADFCEYYESTTTKFDGVIHFGAKEYADTCETYPTSLEAVATEAVDIMSQPSATETSSEKLGTLNIGQKVEVSGLCKNDLQEYWYQLDQGYVPAQALEVSRFLYEDVTAQDIHAPTALRQGKSFGLQGSVQTQNNSLYSLRCQVFSLDGKRQDPVFTSADLVEGQEYSLKNSSISDAMSFRELPLGGYRLELAAVIGSYYFHQGQVAVQWQTLPLWSAQFRVTEKKTDACQITFDPGKGTTPVNRTTLVEGEALGTLPTAQKDQEIFLGWFTEDGERVTGEYVPQEDMTLYARFSTVRELEVTADKCWYLYADGITVMGCAQLDGELYYFTVSDPRGLSGMGFTTLN